MGSISYFTKRKIRKNAKFKLVIWQKEDFEADESLKEGYHYGFIFCLNLERLEITKNKDEYEYNTRDFAYIYNIGKNQQIKEFKNYYKY